MNLAVFDIGGTPVKTAYYDGEKIYQKGSFLTPETFEKLVARMRQNVEQNKIDGIAISAPGIVDIERGIIEGHSAVPYIHNRKIVAELESIFHTKVSIENDANCAGICEVTIGAGKSFKNVAFVIMGTGVGGALFINGRLYKGSHLFGGEFGLIKNENGKNFSHNGSIVKAVNEYNLQHVENPIKNGIELYCLANLGDVIAKNLLDNLYDHIAKVLYTLQVAFDFETFILGGGISERRELPQEISSRVSKLLNAEGMNKIMPNILSCAYHNDANLYGAAFCFTDKFFRK